MHGGKKGAERMKRQDSLPFWVVVCFVILGCGSSADSHPPAGGVGSKGLATLPLSNQAAPVLPSGYHRVPGGGALHEDCVHVVPSGAVVDRDRNVRMGDNIIGRF